eukprot:gene1662-6426_t
MSPPPTLASGAQRTANGTKRTASGAQRMANGAQWTASGAQRIARTLDFFEVTSRQLSEGINVEET